MSRQSDRLHWVALATAAGVGGRTVTRLLERFGSLEAVWTVTQDDLECVPGIGPRTAEAIARVDLPGVEAEMARWAAAGIEVLTWQDDAYPPNLLRTPHAPPVLFVRGLLAPSDVRAVAVVGTRQPAPENVALARQIGAELARRGWTVVSGLALGIDSAAHEGALEAGGRTLAVLGSGLSSVYPRRNMDLAASVAAQGALLSEVHPQARVSRQALIARNRITSGLSRAVIVVQSQADSGSVNTARRAQRQGRGVFAVTGDRAGNVALLAEGAQPLECAILDWDALSERLDRAEIGPPEPGIPAQPRLF